MSDNTGPSRLKRGICCPACGGRVEVRRAYRQRVGQLIRYRRCVACRARVKTREVVLSVLPPK